MPASSLRISVIGGIGVGGAMAAGLLLGNPAAGIAASAGSLGLVITSDNGRGWSRATGEALSAAALAWVTAGMAVALGPFGPPLILGLTAVAAITGGYSRPLAVASTRFSLVLLVTVNVLESAQTAVIPLGLFIAASGLATAGLSLLIHTGEQPAKLSISVPTHAQLWRRWTRVLRQWEGWRHPAPLIAALTVAEALAVVFPGQHAQWIALTLVLLIRRRGEGVGARAVGRVGGTLLGAVLASAVNAVVPSGWGLAVVMTGLGAVRPLLAVRRPLAYAAVMTLLVALMARGGGAEGTVLLHRVVATVIGTVLALMAEQGFSHLPGAGRRSRG